MDAKIRDMKIAIVGLPKSGKTTVFDVLTKGKAEIGTYTTSLVPNVGVARVPDARLLSLENKFHPKKVTPVEISYVDIAGPLKTSDKEEIGGELLNYLTAADALLQVVRLFEDEGIPHPEGSLDGKRDIATLDLELAFSDLTIIQRRLDRVETALRGALHSDREAYLREQGLLHKLSESLERDIPIRQQDLAADESKSLSHYQFLTAKPMLIVLNIGEAQLSQASSLEDEIRVAYPQFGTIALCGKLELELEQLNDTEAAEFREAMGLTQPALEQVIDLSYRVLGLISFFTTASDQLRAWTIPRGTTAPRAAGKIHSDMERGFIRAEVIGYNDLERCGTITEARKRGLLRVEGKNYVINDGDVVTFLFNV